MGSLTNKEVRTLFRLVSKRKFGKPYSKLDDKRAGIVRKSAARIIK